MFVIYAVCQAYPSKLSIPPVCGTYLLSLPVYISNPTYVGFLRYYPALDLNFRDS